VRPILFRRLLIFLVPGLRLLLLRRRRASYTLLSLPLLELLLLHIVMLLHMLQLLLLSLLGLAEALFVGVTLLELLLLLDLMLFDLLPFLILALAELLELLILLLLQLRIDVVIRRARVGRAVVVLPPVVGIVRRIIRRIVGRRIVSRRRIDRRRRAIHIVILLLLNVAIVLLLDIAIVEVWLAVGLIVRLPARLDIRLIRLDARISRLHWRDRARRRSYTDRGSGVVLRRGRLDLAHL